jgi:hypothetical protein
MGGVSNSFVDLDPVGSASFCQIRIDISVDWHININIVLMPGWIRIWIWIGTKMEIRIRIGIKTMPTTTLVSNICLDHQFSLDMTKLATKAMSKKRRKGLLLKSWQIWLSFSFVAVSRRRCR